MNQCQNTVTKIPVAFVERHLQRVGAEREPEYPGILQQPPCNPPPALAAHQPFEILGFGIPIKLLARFPFGVVLQLAVNVG
ncbi:hypothetical protein LH429_16145, partial [Laribacter hongkongensis]|uniref:hypothetical protein n=1 Tax=Laribacter hongkongensis TaxID=168471 RepID=UPI001EFD552E